MPPPTFAYSFEDCDQYYNKTYRNGMLVPVQISASLGDLSDYGEYLDCTHKVNIDDYVMP